jgi:hypothetical protein
VKVRFDGRRRTNAGKGKPFGSSVSHKADIKMKINVLSVYESGAVDVT